jgi:putative PIN family toxin of toxin-antitoxin system
MQQPKIVLDTNCLLPILGAQSRYNFLFTAFLECRYTLCVSTEILLEYEEILRQKASATAADLFLKVIARSQNVVRKDPYFHLGLVKQDYDDNKFVDCAFVCQADIIVTNDSHFNDVAASPFPIFKVMSLDTFAEMMK